MRFLRRDQVGFPHPRPTLSPRNVTKDRDGERKSKAVAEAYRTLNRRDTKLAYDHRMNHICAGQADLTVASTSIGYFSWGLAIVQYYAWLGLNRDGGSD